MSYSGLIEFSITDGTVVIDLLGSNKHGAGFGVQGYVPGRPQLKDGGVWQDSNTESGRQLVFGVDTNIVDVVTLFCGAGSQTQIIKYFQALDLMLQEARAYWTTNWQQQPVYLRARAKGETTTRYALIHYAKYDEYFNPYGQLFAGNGFKVCTEEFALGIEHGPWLDLIPGENESVPITHAGNSGDPIDETSSSFTSGQGMGLVVSNGHQATGGLTSILRDDGGSFSISLLDGSPPYNLFNPPTQVNDAIYFGSQHPFYGLIFDLSGVSPGTVAWEFWNGSAWTAITVTTEVTGISTFQNTGITYARWSPNDVETWATTLVGGDTTNRLWIRARVTGAGGGPTTQGNRHVYATTTSYVEIDDSEIVGTQSALARIDAYVHRGTSSSTDGPFVLVGLRSTDRGNEFSAYLNTRGNNPLGISAAVGTPGTSSFATAARWSLNSSIANQFFGQFRMFVRLTTDDDTAESQIRYVTGIGQVQFGTFSIINTGETKNIPAPPSTFTYYDVLIDLGYVSFPLSDKALYTDPLDGFDIVVQAIVPSGKTISVSSIILLPVDEWTGSITGRLTTTASTSHFVIDGISNPKARRAYIQEKHEMNLDASAHPFLHAGATQRLWFLFDLPFRTSTASVAGSNPALFASVRVAKAQRNMSLRSWPL